MRSTISADIRCKPSQQLVCSKICSKVRFKSADIRRTAKPLNCNRSLILTAQQGSNLRDVGGTLKRRRNDKTACEKSVQHFMLQYRTTKRTDDDSKVD